jgi:hypothetical protein
MANENNPLEIIRKIKTIITINVIKIKMPIKTSERTSVYTR